MTTRILTGDCRERLAEFPAGSAQCCVTSPPYFGLRDYGVAGQIGAEQTPEEYLAALVEVFRAVRRVLANDGTLWLNLGDSYCSTDKWGGGGNVGKQTVKADGSVPSWAVRQRKAAMPGMKPKDLLMIPARSAIALQADGWFLRSHIVWNKPNAMPEPVRDRPSSSHESVFLLAKKKRYFFNADAIMRGDGGNSRNVWTIASQPYAGAHCAVMPPDLAERCILAGSAAGDTVLDPFFGAGTTGLVADRLGRHCIGVELNPVSVAEGQQRIERDAGLFASVGAE